PAGEIAPGDTRGRVRRQPNRPCDRAADVDRPDQDQEQRRPQTDASDDQGVLRRRPRPAVARLTERSLAGEEAAELPSNGLHLLAAAARRVEQRRRSLWITPQEVDERERVRVEVGIDGAPDRDGALVLKPAVSRQPYEGVAGGWILGPSIAPGTK